MIATLTERTSNRKLSTCPKHRPVSVTRAAQVSCPTGCALQGAGCYAEVSFSGIHTAKVNAAAVKMKATPIDVARVEAKAILASWPRDGRPVRLHEVGDCSTPAAARVVSDAVGRAQREGAGDAWTYTHAWRDVPRNAWGPVSVLASCETAEDVTAASARGYATARVVGEFEASRSDSRGIPCPAQTGAAPDCASCRLCMRADSLARPILFEAHGSGAGRVREAVASREA